MNLVFETVHRIFFYIGDMLATAFTGISISSLLEENERLRGNIAVAYHEMELAREDYQDLLNGV